MLYALKKLYFSSFHLNLYLKKRYVMAYSPENKHVLMSSKRKYKKEILL